MLSYAENKERWELAVRKQAFSQTYLLQSVLATVCFYKAVHRPETKLRDVSLAYNYQAVAIEQFLPVLSNVTARNCEPALTCAAMLYVVTLAFPVASASIPHRTYDVVVDVLQLVSLWKGVAALFRSG